MAKSEQVIKDLDRVIGLINTDMKDIPAEEKKQMVADTIDHFDNYVSPGWLKYRKSVSSVLVDLVFIPVATEIRRS